MTILPSDKQRAFLLEHDFAENGQKPGLWGRRRPNSHDTMEYIDFRFGLRCYAFKGNTTVPGPERELTAFKAIKEGQTTLSGAEA